MPTVSVILPNYNYEFYLTQRIETILNQSFQDFELIILDDRSTDGSKKIIEKYRDNPLVSHIVYNEINSGIPFVQWNKGVELATGEWIWIAEADDLCDKDLLERLIGNARKTDNVVLSYCQSYRMDSAGNVTGDWMNWTAELSPDIFNEDFVLDGSLYIERFLKYKNTIPNASGVIFKKKVYLEVGMTDEDIAYCSDWLTWLKLLTVGDVAYSSEKLNYFRYHMNSVIASSTDSSRPLFVYRYDIIMRNRFLAFLRSKKNNNSFEIKAAIKSFKTILSYECEQEAQLMKNNGFYINSLIFIFLSLKHGSNKKGILKRLLTRYLFEF